MKDESEALLFPSLFVSFLQPIIFPPQVKMIQKVQKTRQFWSHYLQEGENYAKAKNKPEKKI